MTFENLNKNTRNRHTSIIADGKRFHSDIEALAHLSGKIGPMSELQNRIPRYDNHPKTLGEYHKGLGEYLSKKGVLWFDIHGQFMQGDWTQEPEQDVSFYVDRMCEVIDNTYDEVLIKNLKVMDASAIALARDNNLPLIVFSLHSPGGFAEVLSGRGKFTIVEQS